MAEIVLDHVTKSYPDVSVAVKDLSLTIADGEFVILVGPSGCGKSTTLNMIAGLEDITSGELRIGGDRVNEKAPRDRDIAMVFQSYALYPHMTVRQNIAFPLTLAKMNKAEIAAKVDETARILDLSEFLDRKPSQLSGGEQQRTAIARAMVHDPKLIIADEPTGNLDPLISWEIIQLLLRINELGTTVLMATHNAEVVTALRKRVVALESGRIVRDEVGGYHRDYA